MTIQLKFIKNGYAIHIIVRKFHFSCTNFRHITKEISLTILDVAKKENARKDKLKATDLQYT